MVQTSAPIPTPGERFAEQVRAAHPELSPEQEVLIAQAAEQLDTVETLALQHHPGLIDHRLIEAERKARALLVRVIGQLEASLGKSDPKPHSGRGRYKRGPDYSAWTAARRREEERES